MDLTRLCAFRERPGRRACLVVSMVAASVFVVVSGTARAVGGSSEFDGFREIVQVSVVEDLNHYEYIPHVRAYPPFFAIFWAPFGLLPVGPSGNVIVHGRLPAWWLVQLTGSAAAVLALMAAMTFWASRCVSAACHPEGVAVPTNRCTSMLLWLLCGGLMLNSVVRAETDMFVVMMVAASMWLLLRKRRAMAAGALLGIATALKLTPGLFGVYLLCRRSWRGLAGMAVAGFCCTVILPVLVWGPSGAYERHRSWTEVVLVPYGSTGPEAIIERAYRKTNQSLTAALTRYLTPYNAGTSGHPSYVNVADVPRSTVSTISRALKLGILAALVAAWAVPPPDGSRELEAVLFGLVPLGMLLISD